MIGGRKNEGKAKEFGVAPGDCAGDGADSDACGVHKDVYDYV